MNYFFKNTKEGFTLVELLVVVIVLSVLSGIVLIAINPAQQRARATATALKTNVASVCKAQALCAVTATTGTAGCTTFALIGMPNPYTGNAAPAPVITIAAASPWTVSGTFTPDSATGVMTFTCQNANSTLSNFGRTSCAVAGSTPTYTCAGFGLQ